MPLPGPRMTAPGMLTLGEQVLTPAGIMLLPFAPPAVPKDGQARDLIATLIDANRLASEAAAMEGGDAAKNGQHAPIKRTRGSSSSVQLNKEIMAARTVEELLALVKSKSAHFDFFNISSAVSRAPKLVEMVQGHAPMGHAAHDMMGSEGDMAMRGSADGMQMSSSGASQAHTSAAHLSPAAHELADRLCAMAMENMRAFDARGLANTAWAFGKLRYVPDAALPALLCSHAAAKIGEFAAQNLSNLAWAMVYMHHRDESLLALMSHRIRALVNDLKPQELANVMWAFASLEHFDPATAAVLGARAARLAPLFKEQELSNIIWALGRAHAYDSRLLGVLLGEARAKLHHFLPQGVSNVVWALGQLGHYDAPLLASISAQFGPALHMFDVQALSNLAWGLAALGHRDEALLSAIAHEATVRASRMSPQNMASVLWACATLGVHHPPLVAAVTREAHDRLASFEPQGLWQLAWGCARLGHHDKAMFEAIAAVSLTKLDRFNNAGLANLAWALSVVGSATTDVFEALSTRIARAAPTFTAPNCSAAAWALANARHASTEAMDALLRRLVTLQASGACDPQHLAVTLLAAAKMGHSLGPLSAHLAASITPVLAAMSSADLCGSMWALAALDTLDTNTFALMSGLLEKHVALGAVLSPEALQQAFSAALMLQASLARHLGVALPSLELGALPRLPAMLDDLALAAWAQAARNTVHAPAVQAAVASTFGAANVPHAVQWLTDDGLLTVDVALQVAGRSIAVELVEPSDLCSDGVKLTGDAAARFRLLQARGWDVVGLTAAQWAPLAQLNQTERAAALMDHVTHQLGPLPWSSAVMPQRGAATLTAVGLDAASAAVLLDSMQQQQSAGGSGSGSSPRNGSSPAMSRGQSSQALNSLGTTTVSSSNPSAGNNGASWGTASPVAAVDAAALMAPGLWQMPLLSDADAAALLDDQMLPRELRELLSGASNAVMGSADLFFSSGELGVQGSRDASFSLPATLL